MNFDRLRFVYNDSCYGGRLKIDSTGTLVERQPGQQGLVYDAGSQSDITLALRLDGNYESRAYHAWWERGWFGFYQQTFFQRWGINVWSKLEGFQNVNDSVLYAVSQAVDSGLEFNDPNSALNTYRLCGQGDISTIRLTSN